MTTCWQALAAVIIVDREVEARNDSMTDSELNSNWALERAGLPYRFDDVAPFSRVWHECGYYHEGE